MRDRYVNLYEWVIKVIAIGVLFGMWVLPLMGQDGQQSKEQVASVGALEQQLFHTRITQDVRESSVLNKMISLQLKQTPVIEALKAIARKGDLNLSYDTQLSVLEKQVTLAMERVSMQAALWKVLEGTGLRFAISPKGQLIIMKRQAFPAAAGIQETITGTVTDAQSGETLPGVNILVKGTTIGTSTDTEGNFELTVPSLEDTLVVSFVGYQTQEVAINGRTEIAIRLQPQAIAGEELVVVGYGTQERSSITSSVSEISGEDIAQKDLADPRQALQGMAAGVSVIDRGGAPGHNNIGFKIRGNTTIGSTYPLVLVNGIEQDFSDINPDNIESISILKDAAATAIYGSRAANGVVLVTTKSPQKEELQVSYNGSFGIQKISQKPDQLGLEKYLRLRNEAYANVPGGEPIYTEKEIQEYVNAENRYKYPLHNTWYDAVFQMAPQQNHSLALSGGSEQLQARLSLNYFNQEGIITNFQEQRKEMHFDANLKVSDRINVSSKLTYRRKDNLRPHYATGGIVWDIWHNGGGFTVPKYPDGTYGIGPRGTNPLMQAEKSGKREFSTDYFVANFEGRIDLLDNLVFTTQFGGHTSLETNSNFRNEITVRDYYTNDVVYQTGFNQLDENRSRDQQWTWRSLLNYDLTFSNHEIETLAGYEQVWGSHQEINAFRNQFYNNDLRVLNAGSEENWSNGGYQTQTRLRSVFGRFRYTYADKYILEANARYDGSSKFYGAKNQYSFFPSFSAAWRLSEENFWGDLESVISEFKLRGSWGKTGNNTVGLYSFFPGINIGTNYVFSEDLVRTAYGYDLANENLTWETTTEYGLGLDTEFWEGLLGLSFDVYKKRTEGILLTLPIPDVVGMNAPPQNAGRVDNEGWELSLTHRNSIGDDFSYSVKANLSDFRNEVVDLAQTGPYTGRNVTKVGEPLEALWGFKALGFFESKEEIENYPTWAGKDNTFPGDLKYADLNGDGVLSPDDKTVIGNEDPHYSFGITANMNYRNFDLSFFIQGVGQQDRIPTGAARECGNWGSLTLQHCEDYWTPDNRDARMPRPQRHSRKNSTGAVNSTWWVVDASYVKLKNLRLGYTMPSEFTSNFGVSRFRVYVSGSNLFTLSEATEWGLDPEFRSGRLNYYPQTTVFSAGVNIEF